MIPYSTFFSLLNNAKELACAFVSSLFSLFHFTLIAAEYLGADVNKFSKSGRFKFLFEGFLYFLIISVDEIGKQEKNINFEYNK